MRGVIINYYCKGEMHTDLPHNEAICKMREHVYDGPNLSFQIVIDDEPSLWFLLNSKDQYIVGVSSEPEPGNDKTIYFTEDQQRYDSVGCSVGVENLKASLYTIANWYHTKKGTLYNHDLKPAIFWVSEAIRIGIIAVANEALCHPALKDRPGLDSWDTYEDVVKNFSRSADTIDAHLGSATPDIVPVAYRETIPFVTNSENRAVLDDVKGWELRGLVSTVSTIEPPDDADVGAEWYKGR